MRGTRFVADDLHLLYHGYSADSRACRAEGVDPPSMELAGPRETIFFDPAKLKCGIRLSRRADTTYFLTVIGR
jgi:6-phosphofructokinase 1